MPLISDKQISLPNISSTKIKRQFIRYVDPVGGNDTTAQSNYSDNNFIYPYLNYSTALSAAIAGEWIVMLPGTYTGSMNLKDGVNIYCEPGVNITNGGFTSSTAVSCQILGFAAFSGSSSVAAINITGGTSVTSDITFEFDKITGTRSFGIFHDNNGTLTVRGNSIFCSVPLRIQSNTKNVNVTIRNFIKGYGTEVITIGKAFSAPFNLMSGEIVINCPVIESTSSASFRTVINFNEALKHSSAGAYKIIIKADVIKMSTATLGSETYPYTSGTIWLWGGDNAHIYGDIIGNKAHCVSNNGGGASYHTGTFYFYGNMQSEIPVISCGTKSANGNGWLNISVTDSYLKTVGSGGLGLIETTNNWNSIIGGTPGTIYLRNCTLYNETVDSNILQLNQPFSTAFLYNCIMYSRGATGFAASSQQASKAVNYINTVSNKANNTTIISNLSTPSFVYDTNLDIPKNNL